MNFFFYIDEIVLLLGQSSNTITYHRKLNVLGCIMNSPYQVKTILKEKAALLQKYDSKLLEKKITNHMADTIKSGRKPRKIFTDSKKPFPWSPSYPPRQSDGQKVFLIKGGESNYGKFNNGRKFRQQRYGHNAVWTQARQQRYGKYTFFKQNFLQHEFISRNELKMGIRKCSLTEKKVVLCKQSSKRSNSRKAKTFLKGLEKINQGSHYPGFGRRLRNTISNEATLIKNSFSTGSPKIQKFQFHVERAQQKLMDKEVKEMLKKWAIGQANIV